jgi:hypothetical protein
MLVGGFIITLISWLVYFSRKNLLTAFLTFIGLSLSYIFFIYRVMFESIFAMFDIKVFMYIVFSIISVVLIKIYMDKYLQNEVGNDIRSLLFDVFPDRRLRLFVLFFMGQLVFVSDVILGMLLIYFLGKLLGVKRVLIFSVGYLSLIVNLLFDQSEMIKYIPEITNAQIQSVNLALSIFYIITMLLSFLFILNAYVFVDHKNFNKITSFVENDLVEITAIITSYVVVFLVLKMFYTLNGAQTISSLIMLIIISALSRKYKHNPDKMFSPIEKELPYIFSVLIVLFNAFFIYVLDQNIYLGTTLIFVFNSFVLQRKFQKVDHINIVEKSNDKFFQKVTLVYMIYFIIYSYVTASAINNSTFGISIVDNVSIYLNETTNLAQLIFYVIGLSPFTFTISNFISLKLSITYDYMVVLLIGSSLVKMISLFSFYVTHELLGIDDEAMRNGMLGIIAFSIIEIVVFVIIMTII